jgi:drug/metabolite transporter (DMT)-like permease
MRVAAFAWMSLGATFFALMNFCARLASANVSWTMVAGTRAFIGALIAILVARVRGVSFVAASSRHMWLRSLFGTGSMISTFYALGSADIALGDAVTLCSMGPIWIAILGPRLLGERSGRRVMIAIPLALSGAVCIVRPSVIFGYSAVHTAMLAPACVAMVGSFLSCFAMIMLRQVSDHETPEAIATHFSLTAALVLTVLSIPHFVLPGGKDALIMVVGGFFAGFGQLCMTKAYSMEFAARVSPFSYLSIVVSALLGAFSLHQWPDGLALLGMSLVITGGVVVAVAGMRDKTSLRNLTRTVPNRTASP